MKQYKLIAWPELRPRFQSTAMRRAVSELSQRFVTTRDLARSCGASPREVAQLVARLTKDGMLMSREAPQSLHSSGSWREWWPVAAFCELVRARR